MIFKIIPKEIWEERWMKFYTDYFIPKNHNAAALGIRTCIRQTKGTVARIVYWGLKGRDITLDKIILHSYLPN